MKSWGFLYIMFMAVLHQRAVYALSPSLQPDVFMAAPHTLVCNCL